LKHKDIVSAAKEASFSIAETAIATPYIFSEWQEWQSCLTELKKAEENLAKTKMRWLAIIQPALSDPLLNQLATRKGVIPNGPR